MKASHCYVIVSAVAIFNGHPFYMSQLHILFRLILLIVRDHTAALLTEWCVVPIFRGVLHRVRSGHCISLEQVRPWSSDIWYRAVCSYSQPRRPQFKFSSLYKPYKYDQAQVSDAFLMVVALCFYCLLLCCVIHTQWQLTSSIWIHDPAVRFRKNIYWCYRI